MSGLETFGLPLVVMAGAITMDRLHNAHRDLPTVVTVVTAVFAAIYLSAGGPTGFVTVLIARAAGQALLTAPVGRSRLGAAVQALVLAELCSVAATWMPWAIESAVLLALAGGLHLLHVRGRGRVFGLDWIPASAGQAIVGLSASWTAAVTAVNDTVAGTADLSGALAALPEPVRNALIEAVALNRCYPQAAHGAIEQRLVDLHQTERDERIRAAAAILLLADREERLAAVEAVAAPTS